MKKRHSLNGCFEITYFSGRTVSAYVTSKLIIRGEGYVFKNTYEDAISLDDYRDIKLHPVIFENRKGKVFYCNVSVVDGEYEVVDDSVEVTLEVSYKEDR